MNQLQITQGSGNVFADLGFDPQAAAAKTLGLTQPRLNQLLKGKIGEFSLDALVNLATCAGMRVGLTIRPMAGVRAKAARTPKAVEAAQKQSA